jgi:hypothetical protein
MKGFTTGEKQVLWRSLHPDDVINVLWHWLKVQSDKTVMCRNPLELSRRKKVTCAMQINRRNNRTFYPWVQASNLVKE